MTDKILIVDDDQDIGEILEFNLKNEGFQVEYAASAEQALTLLDESFNLILLDVMMGGMSGYKMAERLRSDGNRVPIIFLTAKSGENNMLTGFSVGGDDYISKPFSIKEVIARAKAVIKRSRAAGTTAEEGEAHRLLFEGLEILPDTKEVTVDGEPVLLTKTEYEILELLATHPGRLFARTDVIDVVWKETPYITERTVDVHITRLRKKIGEYARFIVNRSGYGYLFKE